MGLVHVSLNEKPYDITCDDGQEEHVAYLAKVLGDRVTALAETVGQVGESRLLLMAGLLVADELVDARAELDRFTGEGAVQGPGSDPVRLLSAGLTEEDLTQMLNGLAKRIEDIAERLKSS
ncbi:MAG: cell division protein ZapA [Rhodospirillales bacterium]|nr:cell division protein ZapA [Rhodospirillales bacterium]